jgi:hypothetical protein
MNAIHGILAIGLALTGNATAQELKPAEPTCRLTYTMTDTDGGKKIGVQHFSLTISPSSPRGTLKLGSKVPVLTGSYNPGGATGAAGTQTQFTYLDVGLNMDATITPVSNGYLIVSKVEQSSVAEPTSTPQPSGQLRDEPVVRQSVLSNTAVLTVGKPVVLGSLDTPGSTRHMEIEVVLELVK